MKRRITLRRLESLIGSLVYSVQLARGRSPTPIRSLAYLLRGANRPSKADSCPISLPIKVAGREGSVGDTTRTSVSQALMPGRRSKGSRS